MKKVKVICGFWFRILVLMLPFMVAWCLIIDSASTLITFLASTGAEALSLTAFSIAWTFRRVLRDRNSQRPL